MSLTTSSVIDYNQPETSPYEQSRTVIVTVGNKKYSIPENYIRGHLSSQPTQTQNPRIVLGGIDSDIGHTILHFLYKGEYETTTLAKIQAETHRVEVEYKRSVQVYYAARKYDIRGLDTLAQNYIMTLSKSLSIFQILRGARLIFSKLPEDEEWFPTYLNSKLSSSFTEDETRFQLDDFYDEILDDPALSKAVLKYIVKAFTTETSRLRNILNVAGVDNESKNDGVEPSCEQTPQEPASEPSNDRKGGSGYVPPLKRSHPANNPTAHDKEQPCGEPAIEVLAVDVEDATPKPPCALTPYDGNWSFPSAKDGIPEAKRTSYNVV
ncbi:hypothetical protein BJY01DRAFT_238187 [Aspergillus pseudoustus]|uniref:BTB domain-containing protein n=1 Tax=Aspergillus pseudoustus TaxID=1810923 RepID=A0ABR4J9J2_9EURO